MNSNRSHLQILAGILKMGASDEGSIRQHLGLAPEEFNRYRSYLLRNGLAKAVTDNEGAGLLQPTSGGEALLRVADKLGALDATDSRDARSWHTAEQDARSFFRSRAATIKMLQKKLLWAYVMEQAEVTRLEAQLEAGGGDDNEGEVELEEHLRKLRALQMLLEAFECYQRYI